MHLLVISGPDTGLEIVVPPAGARCGRVEGNDIVFTDPSMSRFQCQLVFEAGTLCLNDLGSTNQCLVNDQPIQKMLLQNGDMITLGETVVRVVQNTLDAASAAPMVAAPSVVTPQVALPDPMAGAPMIAPPGDLDAPIDLGLRKQDEAGGNDGAGGEKRNPVKMLLVALVVVVVVVGLMFGLQILLAPKTGGKAVAIPGTESGRANLQVTYEKVQASSKNIFRYYLSLDGNVLTIQYTDLQNQRAITKKVDQVDPALIEALAKDIQGASFFRLEDQYEGISRDKNLHDVWDVHVTLGTRTKSVRVRNRLLPPELEAVLEHIEDFGTGLSGLLAMDKSPEELKDLARESYLEARKLKEGRSIRRENLYQAIKNYQQVELYLQAIEPKPAYYEEAIADLQQAQIDLDEALDAEEFQADRAMNLRDWESASRSLRAICDMVPDRNEKRYRDAERKLLIVERNLN